jgi:UDP:flavonoid glycosyltransferase YjiC (YdhE family)
MARVQDRPPVFILLGTTPLNDRPDFFRMCLAAFAGTNWQEAMAIGDRMNVSELATPDPRTGT